MDIWPKPRRPCAAVLPGESQAEAEASPESRRHLEALDEIVLRRIAHLGVRDGLVLDVGTGLAQIPIKLALREPTWILHAVDISDAMLRQAALDAGRWGVDMRIILNAADALELPYESNLFDLVICNLVLHRAADPVRLVGEMGRVAREDGALLLRDFSRPGRLLPVWLLRRWGKPLDARLREILEISLNAAYTLDELKEIARKSGVSGLRASRMPPHHIGLMRIGRAKSPAQPA